MPASLRSIQLVCVGLAFFLSGAAALAYQVAWQRILALQTGVGLYSIAVIVAAFMLGLGLGSHLGARGQHARDRRARADPVRGVRAGHRRLRRAEPAPLLRLALRPPRLALRGAAARRPFCTSRRLLVPTVLMGMSLPFLTRAMVRRAETAGGTIAFLYGINVLGAAAGALATPWVFMRHYGVGAALWGAVAANLVAGLSALALALWRTAGEGAAEADPEGGARPATRRRRRPDGSGAGSPSMPCPASAPSRSRCCGSA